MRYVLNISFSIWLACVLGSFGVFVHDWRWWIVMIPTVMLFGMFITAIRDFK